MERLMSEDPVFTMMKKFADEHPGIGVEMRYHGFERVIELRMTREIPGTLPRINAMKIDFDLIESANDIKMCEIVNKELNTMYTELVSDDDIQEEKGEKHVLQDDTQN